MSKKYSPYTKKKRLAVRIFVIIIAAAMLLGIVIMPILSDAEEDGESITVASFETGGLAEALTEAADGTDFNFIKNVAVLEGTLNADDYKALTNIPNLEILELATAFTEDGVIPENALTSRNQLMVVTLPKNTVEIGKNAFSNNRKLIKVFMPGTVTTIDDYAFAGCEALNAIPISAGITYIGEGAFQDCKSIIEFIIPNGITEIYANTFSKCGFEKISIGPDVKKIGMSVFADCNALKDIYVYGTEAPALDSDVFRNVSATIHCYEEAEESFESWEQNNIKIAADLTGEYTLSAEIPEENNEAYAETALTVAEENTEASETEVSETEAVTDGSADENITTSEETASEETSAQTSDSNGLSVGVVVVIVIMAVVIAVLATMLVMMKKNGSGKN